MFYFIFLVIYFIVFYEIINLWQTACKTVSLLQLEKPSLGPDQDSWKVLILKFPRERNSLEKSGVLALGHICEA